MNSRQWTEDDVLRVLWRHFQGQGWWPVPQVTVSTADTPGLAIEGLDTGDRRIDMLAVRRPRDPAKGPFESLALEVKVSRSDLLADVANPAKQAPWRRAATRHAYVVPVGLVQEREIPEHSGLMVVRSHHSTDWGWGEWVRKAPYIRGHLPELPDRVFGAILGRVAALEGHTRGWNTGSTSVDSPQELRAALQAAQKATDQAQHRAERAQGQVQAWRAAFGIASKDGIPCTWCGQAVKPLRPKGEWFQGWAHVNHEHDQPCRGRELQYLEQRAEAFYTAATVAEREKALRQAHARHPDRFDPAAEADPWRAYLDTAAGMVVLDGPMPAGVITR